MALAPARQVHLPTRDEVRAVPTIVWVYSAIAVVALALELVSDAPLSISRAIGAIEFTAPAFFAAAIANVAPRSRLAQLSAAAFAIPVAVTALIEFFNLSSIVGATSGSSWDLLVPTITGFLGTLSSLRWPLTLVAVVALALCIGRIETRTGWVLFFVGLGATAIWVGLLVVNVISIQNQIGDLEIDLSQQLLFSPLAALVGVGWSLLLAIAAERRHLLLVLAAAAQLVLAVLGVLVPTLFAGWFQEAALSGSVVFDAYLFVLSVLALTFVVAMFFGITRELPRHGRTTATDDQTSDTDFATSQ